MNHVHDIRVTHLGSAKLPKMQGNRDKAISDFVRKLIREAEQNGRKQYDIAHEARTSTSMIAQVKRGTGVGDKTGPGFARAFGFRSFDDLKAAAYKWWLEGSEARAAVEADESVEKAVRAVLDLQPDATEAQLRTILEAFAHPRFRGREFEFWFVTLLAELKSDKMRDVERKAEQKAEKASEKRRISDERAAWNQAPKAKERLAEAERKASEATRARRHKRQAG